MYLHDVLISLFLPFQLTLIFCAYVAGWGWDSYDYDFTDYGYDDYLGSGDDYYDYDEYDLMDYGYSDYDYSDYGDSVDYYYDIFDVMEPKCRIKPWTRKHTCPKIYAGQYVIALKQTYKVLQFFMTCPRNHELRVSIRIALTRRFYDEAILIVTHNTSFNAEHA